MTKGNKNKDVQHTIVQKPADRDAWETHQHKRTKTNMKTRKNPILQKLKFQYHIAMWKWAKIVIV